MKDEKKILKKSKQGKINQKKEDYNWNFYPLFFIKNNTDFTF